MAQLDYDTALAEFAGELRGFLALTSGAAGFGLAGAPGDDALVQAADQLAARSTALIGQTSQFLAAADPAVCLGAEQHLLAHAATSLKIADQLLAAAAAQEGAEVAPVSLQEEATGIDELLAALETPLEVTGAKVQATALAGLADAPPATRAELLASVDETMEGLLQSASKVARDTLTGMVGLDTALLKQAAKLVSADLAEVIDKLGATVSSLVAKAVTFIVQAYDSLLAALGQEATSRLRQQAAEWLERLQQGDALARVLGAILETQVTRQQVGQVVEASSATEPVLGQTRSNVEALKPSFQARTKLIGQILAALAVIKRIPAAKAPTVELGFAAIYVLLLGTTVYFGADYVDAPRLERLGRIPGVLHTVEAGLAAA